VYPKYVVDAASIESRMGIRYMCLSVTHIYTSLVSSRYM